MHFVLFSDTTVPLAWNMKYLHLYSKQLPAVARKTYIIPEISRVYNKTAELKTGGTHVQLRVVPLRTVYREGHVLVLRRCRAMASLNCSVELTNPYDTAL